MTSVVAVRELSHYYGDRKALSGVSFEVQRAEIFSLLGPNGSGKTTLFRILSTLYSPSEGIAEIFGLDLGKQASAVRRRIGIVFQNPSLDGKLTVVENLTHQGRLYGLRGRQLRSRIDDMMIRTRLADRAGELVEKLSGGLQRRVELAKGLLHQPELLILDEPSVGLDPVARHDLWQYLEQLRTTENVTILLTTHLIDEADRSDRILILNEGSVVALGSPQVLKQAIGGDIIALTSQNPEELRDEITRKFSLKPVLLNGSVRIERPDGHAFIAELVESLPGMIESVTLRKPTLKDVFIDRTGHRVWEEH